MDSEGRATSHQAIESSPPRFCTDGGRSSSGGGWYVAGSSSHGT